MRFIFKYDEGVFKSLNIDRQLAARIENSVLKATLLQIYSNWSELANDNLNGTRINYVKGLVIQGGQANRNTGSISLKGVVNNMLEKGCSAFDMKCIVNAQTNIFTSKGNKHIKDIKVGDLVLTHKGKFKKVSNIFKEKNEDRFIYKLTVKIKNESGRWENKNLFVTKNHPLLTNHGWIRADELDTTIHKLFVSANRCNQCNKILPCEQDIQIKKIYCNKSCSCTHSNKSLRIKGRPDLNSIALLNIGTTATKTNMRLLKENKHTSQPGGKLYEKILEGPNFGTIISPEKRREMLIKTNTTLGKKARAKSSSNTMPEELLFERIKDIKGIETQYPFKRDLTFKRKDSKKEIDRYFFFDFAIPEHKIAIEVNGEKWHTKEEDELRKKEVESKGWIYISFWSQEIFKKLDECVEEIYRILNNHEDKYILTKVNFEIEKIDLTKLNSLNTKFNYKYNLTVEDDSSYIANSIVTHNSGFANSSKKKFNSKGEWFLTIPISDKSQAVSILINSQLPAEIFQLINQTSEPTQESSGVYSEAQQAVTNTAASRIPKAANPVINNINQIFETYKSRSQINVQNIGNSIKSGNVSFRRVGQNSRPDSWIHKGLIARNFSQKAIEKFKSEQQANIVRNITAGILKEEGIL